MRVIERVVRSIPLSEANVWIKRSVVMKSGTKSRFHNGVESIDKPKSRQPQRNATLKAEAKRKFQRGMKSRRRAKRLQTKHEVLLDSVSATPRTRSVSAERIKQKWTTLTSNPLHTRSEKKGIYFRVFHSIRNITIMEIREIKNIASPSGGL